ncbi:sigma-54 dependent transcriptional regulator [Thermodesulfobacteriota bacterium]
MLNTDTHNILWTATDSTLPQAVFERLETQGYKIKIAEGRENTLAEIQKVSPRLWIGQINGEPEAELIHIQDIRSACPELPIIIMSPEPSIEEAVNVIRVGANDYLPISSSQDRLWAVFENILHHPCPVSINTNPTAKRVPALEIPIAKHPLMLKVIELAKKIAPSRSNVLIQGESGTGKEVIAHYIHKTSDRKAGPFIAVNCAALPENLLESELFGHERGAFTGAVSRKKGKFELAHGGTLLLDEISEMAVSVQAKLLRVLQEREIDRVGGQATIPIDVRVIATTNRNLEEETGNGNFRLDLYYRLNVVPIYLPALRKRPDDIAPLAHHFLEKYASLNNREQKKLSSEAIDLLIRKSWSGNVRELENLMERAVLLVDEAVITPPDIEFVSTLHHPEGQSNPLFSELDQVIPLKEMEKKMIIKTLNDNSGNRTRAAEILGISVRTLRNKLHEYRKDMDEEAAALL